MKRILILIFTITFCFICSNAGAATYYADLDAAENGNGSFASPWNSLGPINDLEPSPGDGIYLRCGTTSSGAEKLRFDLWTGTAENRITIGAYYVFAGAPVHGVNEDGKPTIHGNDWTYPGEWDALIRGHGIAYVTIENISVSKSYSMGIYIGGHSSGVDSTNVIIRNCYVYGSARSGIMFISTSENGSSINYGVKYSIIQDNLLEWCNYPGIHSLSTSICLNGGWREGTVTHNIVRGNILRNGTEGIGLYKSPSYNIVEYNEITDHRTYSIYNTAESHHNIIRYNLIYSALDGRERHGGGIVCNNEAVQDYWGEIDCSLYYSYHDIEIYGNMIAGGKCGIRLVNGCSVAEKTCKPPSSPFNIYVYNNTIVDNSDMNIDIVYNWDGFDSEIKNNISAFYDISGTHVIGTSRSGITWSHNNYSSTVEGNAADNAVIGVPSLSKTSGWRALTVGAVDGTEFALTAESNCIDAGTHLTLTTNTGAGATAVVTVANSTYFYDGWGITGETADYIYIEDTGKVQILSVDSATQITLTANATWGTGKKVYFCPSGVCFSGSAPDIGANEFVGETTELRAQWDFEDDPGILKDSTGTYDLTDHGTVLNVAGLGGIWGEAADFNGSDQWLQHTGAASDYGWNASQQCTVCAWVNADNLPGVGELMDLFDRGTVGTTTFEMSMSVDEDGSPTFYTGYDGTHYDTLTFTGGDLVEDQWYWICFAINDSGATVEGLADQETRIRIWDNTAGTLLGGAEETPLMTHHWLGGQGGDTYVGCYGGTSYFWDGMIDSFRFYSKVLSSADMDALRTSAMTVSAFFHCDVDKVQIESETTYGVGNTCYLCTQSSGGNVFFADGPVGNLQIGTDMSYPDKEEFEYLTGIGTNIIQFYRVIQAGDRDLDLQAEGTAEDVGLIHGATKLTDVGGAEITYTLPQADPAGGNIIITGLYPVTAPRQLDATNTLAAYILAGGWPLPDEFYTATVANSIGTVDLSAYDGTSGHQITIDGGGFADDGVQTYGDYYTIKRMIK